MRGSLHPLGLPDNDDVSLGPGLVVITCARIRIVLNFGLDINRQIHNCLFIQSSAVVTGDLSRHTFHTRSTRATRVASPMNHGQAQTTAWSRILGFDKDVKIRLVFLECLFKSMLICFYSKLHLD